jgi:acyl carrier protein
VLNLQKVKERMALVLNIPLARVSEGALLQELVADSFILIDMVIDLQNEFKVRLNQEDLVAVKSVGDLLAVLQSKSL